MHNLSKNEAFAVFVGILVVGVIFFGTRVNPFAVGTTKVAETVTLTDSAAQPAAAYDALLGATNSQGVVKKLITEDVKVGEGSEIKAGDTITVHYAGALQDGTQFDNSYSRGTPYTFVVGAGTVIKGWDQGVLGMKLGGQRIIVVPAELGYGSRQLGPIPPNSTLVFAVEVLEVK